MPFEVHRSGYHQPRQARAFGTAALAVGGMLVALLFSIRLLTPPTPVIEAGKMEAFVARSIPLDQPAAARSDPWPPDRQPPATVIAPPAPPLAVSVPVLVAPPSVAVPVHAPLAPPAPERALPSTAMPSAHPVESPARPAPAALGTAAPGAAAADWRARLLGHLKRYRRYPRQAEAARQQGVVRVAITLRRSGDVVGVDIVHGSGYPLLDMEARTTVSRASPLPAVDEAIPDDPVTVEVPIDFALRR